MIIIKKNITINFHYKQISMYTVKIRNKQFKSCNQKDNFVFRLVKLVLLGHEQFLFV